MTLQALEHALQIRESLPSHPLFKITKDLQEITSPSDIGFHPDTVLSVLDYFHLYPKYMPASGVRGEDFIAIRCAPVDEYDLAHAKVECVYLRYIDKSWAKRRLNQSVSEKDFEVFTKLAQSKPVQLEGRTWKRI